MVKLFKMTTQRGVLTHAHWKMVVFQKVGIFLSYEQWNSIMNNLSKEETKQSDTTFQEYSYWLGWM